MTDFQAAPSELTTSLAAFLILLVFYWACVLFIDHGRGK